MPDAEVTRAWTHTLISTSPPDQTIHDQSPSDSGRLIHADTGEHPQQAGSNKNPVESNFHAREADSRPLTPYSGDSQNPNPLSSNMKPFLQRGQRQKPMQRFNARDNIREGFINISFPGYACIP
ncbi:hypothetical protein H4582DRAFT_2099131 [Lactarius indigo]|nr:hypothetical protein H4582DRAFT_2099131 [Lactarius indigo]